MAVAPLPTALNVVAPAQALYRPSADELDLTRKLFLVVDAQPDMRSALNMTLTSFGANRVEFASRNGEALSRMRRTEFDVILCDYDLEHPQDGLNLLDEARLEGLIKPSAVFMIVTSESRKNEVTGAAEQGPDAYLLKPFSGESLRVRLIRAFIKKRAFTAVDEAILNKDYLIAIGECEQQVRQRSEFSVDFLKLKGRLELQLGLFPEAAQSYQRVLQIRPVRWAKVGLAKARVGQRQMDEARKLLREVQAEDPQVMEVYDWLAKLEVQDDKPAEALAWLEAAVQRSPRVARRQKSLGEVAIQNGKLEIAESALAETVRLSQYAHHRNPTDHALLAKVQRQRKDFAAAKKTVAELRKNYKLDPKAQLLADAAEAQTLQASGEKDKARNLLNAIEAQLASTPHLPTDLGLEVAEAALECGRPEASDRIIGQLMANGLDDPQAEARISTLYQQHDRSDIANRMIDDSKAHLRELNNQAVRAAQAGNLREAVDLFVNALAETPNNLQVLLNAVNALLAVVNKEGWNGPFMKQALDYLNTARSIDPFNTKYQRLQEAWRQTRKRFGVGKLEAGLTEF